MAENPNPQEKLKLIANKIISKNFSEKPTYNQIIEQENTQSHIKDILSKLSKITKYFLISPLHIIYKQGFEKSKERDKCPICLCEFYEEEIAEYEKNPANVDSLIDKSYDAIILEKCTDHFFHIECLII